MFNHMDRVIPALAKKKTQWKEDLVFPVKLARPKHSKYYAEVTLVTGMLQISAHIHDPFRKLRSFWQWSKGIDITPEDETSYMTQYQEAFQNYVENEYCTKNWRVPDNKLETIPSSNLIPPATASGSYQSSFDPYDLSSDDDQYLAPNHVAGMTPGRTDRSAPLLRAASLYLNSLPEVAKKWGQINQNLNDYHSDPLEISSKFWILDITDWWRQQEETHTNHGDLSNVACDILSIIPHGVRVEASASSGGDVIGWRQSKTTCEALR